MAADAELIRAPLLHTPGNPFTTPGSLALHEDGGLLLRHGRVVASGDFTAVRAVAADATVTDWRGGYVLPGLIDTHVHFPQLRVIGGLGQELLDWLSSVALPEEARMGDRAYAAGVARAFVHALASHGTTTALVFAAHFADATACLFDEAIARGIRVVSGLVVSDRALRPELHQSPETAYRDSTSLIERYHGRDRMVYAVTPRFALSASEAMLEMCATLLREHPDVRFHTHINENLAEIAACVGAFEGVEDYLAIYERFGLIGRRAVLAHDVHVTDAELARMAASGTAIAHCPCSNAALGSGIFPMRRHVDAGVTFGLGTDVGGGIGFGILKEALHAYLMQRVIPEGMPLSPAHLLYLATRAGAEALGMDDEIGDLSAGKAADLVCVRPPAGSPLAGVLGRVDSLEQALAAIVTMAGAESIAEVRVAGTTVYERDAPSNVDRQEPSGSRRLAERPR